MGRKSAQGDAQASTENANTEKENDISTGNATAEDAQATTENANTGKQEGISTESAAAEDTKNKVLELHDAARKIDIRPPLDSERVERVLRSQGATTSDDKGKGKEVVSVDDPEAATENTNTEEEIGDSWDGDRVPRSQSASGSDDMIEGNKVVKIGDKDMADEIESLVKELTLINSHYEEELKACYNALAAIDAIEAAMNAKEKNSAAEGPHATTEDLQASTEFSLIKTQY